MKPVCLADFHRVVLAFFTDFRGLLWNDCVKTFRDRAAFCVTATLQLTNIILAFVAEVYFVKAEFDLVSLAIAASAPTLIAFRLIPILLPATLRRTFVCAVAAFFTSYSFFHLLLVLHRIHRKFTLDFRFAWYNLGDSYRTLEAISSQFYLVIFGISLLLWLHYLGVVGIIERTILAHSAKPKHLGGRTKTLLSASGLVFLVGVQLYVTTEFNRFILRAFLPRSGLVSTYDIWFHESLRVNKANELFQTPRVPQWNLFMVQLESVNAQLVNRSFTPNFVEIAQQYGILFPKIQSSSVMTVRAQETILCSVLPSLRKSIAQMELATAGLVCLPEILKNHGFRTLYFQSYPDLSFGRIDRFVKALGFDEIHSSDIMQPGDTLLPWGYPDDLFYRRVFEYLERYRQGERVFVYIAVSSTNHFPFHFDRRVYESEKTKRYSAPIQTPSNFRERIANTTYLQDQFFGSMFRDHYLKKYASNSTLFVFGDHSWPIGIHDGNEFNENLAFQENFVSSLAIIPPGLDREAYFVGKTVTALYSQLDIMPTILEMYGIDKFKFFGRSFLAETNSRADPLKRHCVLSVQPFSAGYIAVINYPLKDIFNLSNESVTTYNLSVDPDEASPISRRKNDAAALERLNGCLVSLSR
jgi:hypothetical protein